MALLSDANTLTPQISEENTMFFKKVEITTDTLPLPEVIKDNVIGIVNAVGHNAGVNKFLFEGPPGTGKTETAKQIARILERELFSVDFSALVDSKMGQTIKNISLLLEEIKNLRSPQKAIILFDEIDAIAIDRINSNDLLIKFKFAGRNMRLFKKIISLYDPIPFPGELKNLIKTEQRV